MSEHSFRKKIHHYIPDPDITDRLKLNESTLNNSRLYPYPEDGYDYEEDNHYCHIGYYLTTNYNHEGFSYFMIYLN